MPEHLIRLRGGWEWHEPGAGPARRVTLPMTWPAGPTGRVRLLRPFRRPPLDPAREALALRLGSVAGLIAVRLNDRELARPDAGLTAVSVPIDDPLPPRNVLELDVEPPAGGEPWGTIALVITERKSAIG